MKKYTFVFILLLSNFILISQKLGTSFQSIIDSIYATAPESVGIMLHVEAPDYDISESYAVGYSNKETQTALKANQPFLIASSIKPYVSTTMLRLQEEGILNIEDAIINYLTPKTRQIFQNDGYNLEAITIKHLLSHTSGIEDYANADYISYIDKNPTHRWTRNEQLALAVKKGKPLGKPGEIFRYADANYLLCTEIMEQVVQKPFYETMRKMLKWDNLNIKNTWFPTLENQPKNTESLSHQYWSRKNWDSYDIDVSFDLYGGGGIASTTKDMAVFSNALFNYEIIEDSHIHELIYSHSKIHKMADKPYYLGLSQNQYSGYNAFGHGGFWGTTVQYFPAFNASVSISVQNKDYGKLRAEILEKVVKKFKKFRNHKETNLKIQTYISKIDKFNGSILVAHNDTIVSSLKRGYANLQHHAPITKLTQFNVGSVAKLFTAVGILKLHDEGKLNIYNTVGQYLPDYPNEKIRESVYIHQLLSHTSGVAKVLSTDILEKANNKYQSLDDYVSLIIDKPLEFEPGNKYIYSGGGYILLGLIIEAVAHKSYYEFMQEDVFGVAGMNQTEDLNIEELNRYFADGYTSYLTDETKLKKNDYYLTKTTPADVYYTTAEDLLKFSSAMTNGTLLKTKTWEDLITPRVWGYFTQLGLGIDIDHRYNQKLVGYSAGTYGLRVELVNFLGDNYTFILLSNIDDNGEKYSSKIINDLKKMIAGKKR